ncbi:MAG: amidase [Candidatus Micrarchaeota archaeon]
MTPLYWDSATVLSRKFASRQSSPVELLETLLARIAALEPKINVFIHLDAEGAMSAARAAERELAAGRGRGPLHGIPMGIKDNIDVAGLPMTCHSKILLENKPSKDATVVKRLRDEGAIILGKLSMHEFATGAASFDLPCPPARNPWNRDYHPGGSSSGSGAGLAIGFFPLALGTDTGGSVRNPASACGVVGLKPTYGLVSRRGVFPLAFTLDYVGPMARTVADVAVLLDASASQDPADPGSVTGPIGSYSADLGGGVRNLRIGFVRHFHEIDMPAELEVATALDEVARVLTAEGASVRPITLPNLNVFFTVNRVILQSEAWAVHAHNLRTRPGDYGETARRRLLTGAFLSAEDYVQAQRQRARLIAAVQDAFRDVDILLTANSMNTTCRIDDAEAIARTLPRQARTPFNVTGHPAVTMMAGLSKAGLPLGVQFVGRYFEDSTVLRVAAAYEHATSWHSQHPPEL